MVLQKNEEILILDFGSQYTQLIARRVREQQVYSEIVPYQIEAEQIRAIGPKGIILSGGPASIYNDLAPLPDQGIFDLNIPILGICYGLQIIGHLFGGEVDQSVRREFGHAKLSIDDHRDLFQGIGQSLDVWMSHGDHLTVIPPDFDRLGHTENAPYAVIGNRKRNIFGVQFHPEVVHTSQGHTIIRNFLFRICGCEGIWTPEHFIESSIKKIKEQVKDKKIICGLSGGVDSAVTALLIHRSVGDQLTSIFVDNGLLRKGEAESVINHFKDIHLKFIDASDDFLSDLKGITDPEEKRKIIGKRFIQIFEEEAERMGEIEFLAQGTLYPDVIESQSTLGPSVTIKSHHNVGGLPENMRLQLIEPLRELFKDEVREVGKILGVPDPVLQRHPFPGPGLAVRIIGEIDRERLDLLRETDVIFLEELKASGWYSRVWQAFTVLLPVRSVGVMGDERTYEFAVVLRAVTSLDGMTADWAKLPPELLNRIANRIINEVRGINRVVYDISSKPPSTIEWE
ncbi:glutamine-hydrolyzing GMP synthase [bacterium]|nr:glutamine-hydrolyzing GMP synthase [bacterium]RQV93668.1 MAG: glutamine-hydrolyzing GMP synthase [bacterium]